MLKISMFQLQYIKLKVYNDNIALMKPFQTSALTYSMRIPRPKLLCCQISCREVGSIKTIHNC